MMSKKQFRVLIVDDSKVNRDILRHILEDECELDEAVSGEEAIEKLNSSVHEYDMMLLDFVLPGMNGFDVLAYMEGHHWIEYLPVIMISSQDSRDTIRRAYSHGVVDYVRRPFDDYIVRQRVKSTLALYAKQRKMEAIIAHKIAENQTVSDMMTAILSHIVEFRNGESGPHVLNIKRITAFLLEEVVRQGRHKELREVDIPLICNAAALHDIGKVTIPDEVLNKPGRFTPEEYETMKKHSAAGAEMLRAMPMYRGERLVQVAEEICRWHHERYDGSGYPDGLVGEQIPIWVQAVALADVYDAMTSDRCYRKGYSHEQAVEMIGAGECGAFSEEMLQCMRNVGDKLRAVSLQKTYESGKRALEEAKLNFHPGEETLFETNEMLRVAEAEHCKVLFLASQTGNAVFSYRESPSLFAVSKSGAQLLGCREAYPDPAKNPDFDRFLSARCLERLVERSQKTSRAQPDFEEVVVLHVEGKPATYRLHCRTIWVSGENEYYGFVGSATRVVL